MLSQYLRDLYQQPGIAETVDIDYVKAHYYQSHTSINPTQIVSKGPELNFMQAHNLVSLFPINNKGKSHVA